MDGLPTGSGGGDGRGVKEGDAASNWAVAAGVLARLYGHREGFEVWLTSVKALVERAAAARGAELRAWDRRSPPGGWWREPGTVGYSAYVDQFGGDLTGVEQRLDYLRNLGVAYLHLLPLMKPRAGESDGGYAVADFEDVNPALGTLDDFRGLLAGARERGVQVVVDLVCNHVADDHRWALAAKAGDARHRAYFHMVDTRAEVDAWEADLLEVFPDSAPGNFTWSDEAGAWVWTTFYPYQWDLNYANPDVFLEMTSALLNLANMGVAGFRLDSTGFLWKRAGTTSRNQPEAHLILAAWRALLSIVSPAVVLKAEAIDRLEDVLPYFGTAAQPECDLAYANGVMAGAWASLALGEAEPIRKLIEAAAARPARSAWIQYIRCHDDIIFSGLSPDIPSARQREAALRLTDRRPDVFGDGRVFQEFEGTPSVNGMAASLCGADDDVLGLARLKLIYGVCFALDGLPVIYMGDELALPNDFDYAADPEKAAEGRWLQRPPMDWAKARAAEAGDESAAGAMHAAVALYARLRRERPVFRDGAPARVENARSGAVLSFRRGGQGELHVLANFSDQPQEVDLPDGDWRDLLGGRSERGGTLRLAPYEILWMEAA